RSRRRIVIRQTASISLTVAPALAGVRRSRLFGPLYLFCPGARADHEAAAPGFHLWGGGKFGQSPTVRNASTDKGRRPANSLIACSVLGEWTSGRNYCKIWRGISPFEI